MRKKRKIGTKLVIICITLACVLLLALNLVRLHHITHSIHPSERKEISDKTKQFLHCRRMKSVDDVRGCFPERVRALNAECETITDWGDVQHCLNRRFTNDPIYEIHIIGERNSGTKFAMRELQRCFPHDLYQFKVHRDFIREKHFFQPLSYENFRNSLVVAIFRDPVEWMASMREKPYHSPAHLAGFANDTRKTLLTLPWQNFVNKPWTMPRSKYDTELSVMNQSYYKEASCRFLFRYNELVPCIFDNSSVPEERWRGFEPVYELQRDGSGRPFSSILELREDKIVNFLLQIPLLMDVGGYKAIRYEDLVQKGTRYLQEEVARMVGVSGFLNCSATAPQRDRLGHRAIDPAFRQWVLNHVDPSIERLLGYAK